MPQHFTCICSTDETTGKVYRRVEKSGAFHDEYTYSYDEAGHLKEVFRNDMLRESYTYNGKGQRTLRLNGWDDGAVRYKYDDNGCLLAMICNNSRLFDYDETGNLIRSRELVFQQPDKEIKYFYQDTLLRGVILPDGTELVYVYDEDGKNTVCPVAKYKNGNLVMEFTWKDIRFLESCVDVERGIRFDFTYKNGKLASVHLSRTGMERMRLGDFGNGPDILSRLGGGGTLLAFCDQVGTPKLFTNKAGRHIKEMGYDSFGILDVDSLPDLFIPIGFAGGLVDEDTGFVRFGFRDYDPMAGRFTCPDPAMDMRGDGDLYDYCVDDPVSYIDPNGLWTESTFDESKVKRDGDGQFSSGGGLKKERSLINAIMSTPGSFISSGENFVKDITQAVLNPKQTLEGVAGIFAGYTTQVLGRESEYRAYSQAMTEYLRSRYGSWEHCKETLATDPVGFLADISTGLSVGGGLVRAGGTASKAGKVARVGKITQIAGSKLDILQLIGAAVGRFLEKKFPQRARKIAKAGVAARVANSVGQKAGTQRAIDRNREK